MIYFLERLADAFFASGLAAVLVARRADGFFLGATSWKVLG